MKNPSRCDELELFALMTSQVGAPAVAGAPTSLFVADGQPSRTSENPMLC